MRPPPPSSVYFCQPVTGGPIKVGSSIDVPARVITLMQWSPIPLKLLAYVPGGKIAEGYVHRLFRDIRLHGEWFSPAPDLLNFIARAVALGAIPGSPTGAVSYDYKARLNVYDRLRALGLKRADLAAALGLSPMTVNNWRTHNWISELQLAGVIEFFAERGCRLAPADLYDPPVRTPAASQPEAVT